MSNSDNRHVSETAIARMLRNLRRGAAIFAGFAMLAMMLTGALDVFGTNALASPIPAAFEFMATMMVIVIFFSIALAQAQRAHIQVTVLTDHLPKPLRKLTEILQYLCNLTFFALIAWFGWKSGLRGYEVGEYVSGAINFPIWPARFALALGASLMVLQCVYDLFACLTGRNDATETERAVERESQLP
ncbi:Tripartite ATP-independent periplasmic transporters, DctQ component [Roseovarius albus]|uniref:TRAP transporter small permease protein n=1 Tax=Roseovarius albus TaxID=1247867 RepID=A0A1X7A9W7_9RHOB|nr:TRAP transporter small permease [Roseovarius albus]SLN73790.1 Tripartite ATP-independent periplasmic transporters, DctQ component [Roseovarius albus]